LINYRFTINSFSKPVLNSHLINTPIGTMIAIADEHNLFLLEFTDSKEINIGNIIKRKTKPIEQIEEELKLYFSGKLKTFKTPIYIEGSEFQKKVWNELLKIPYGETRSYKQQAISLGNSNAFRAVANANGVNKLAIIIPCHRIIHSNGKLGGYAGGIEKKEWLLNHENNNKRN